MSSTIRVQRIRNAIQVLHGELQQLKGTSSHWTGELSTSALSTATAVSALSVSRNAYAKSPWTLPPPSSGRDQGPAKWDKLIERGSVWLSRAQNADGGFGDTDRSLSNIATTLLVLAAWQLAGHNQRYTKQIALAWSYVEQRGSWDGLRQRYGKDKTFVVPIMTNCALAGIIDWGKIPTLPFEAAVLPQSWYRFVQLPVVSYAIPALVAIGQAQFVHRPPSNPVMRWIRSMSVKPSLRVLTNMQPTSGGYLEAVPLTSFVLMSLASIGQANCRVSSESRKFIIDSVLADGSWPIDTNLASWVTSLATPHYYDNQVATLDHHVNMEWDRTIDWLLSCQHRQRHPFTGAEPGGWGWTNLSGAVPDADDTPGALIALKAWYDARVAENHTLGIIESIRMRRVIEAAAQGCRWLVKLQNRDGGWPTFCRGWGTLPFDRSGSDLTAHAIRALHVWAETLEKHSESNGPRKSQIESAMDRGWSYLARQQSEDGSWQPLWFGNQDRPLEDNPVYGTGRVLLCYSQCKRQGHEALRNGRKYLIANQNPDGGWGGGPNTHYPNSETEPDSVVSTVEETAIALEGIMSESETAEETTSIMAGLDWLCSAVESSNQRYSQPIGFYFARLWYYEKLYPLVYSLSALKKGLEFCQR
jgi:squalene-hopene/tetraprenyl-beta-curcumene cyclase